MAFDESMIQLRVAPVPSVPSMTVVPGSLHEHPGHSFDARSLLGRLVDVHPDRVSPLIAQLSAQAAFGGWC